MLDPFAGSGSTLAEAVGHMSTGFDSAPEHLKIANKAIPTLSDYGDTEKEEAT